ncbi:hypothetical protein AVEN_266672-1, partial [Araneus ventricosus]
RSRAVAGDGYWDPCLSSRALAATAIRQPLYANWHAPCEPNPRYATGCRPDCGERGCLI